MRARVPALLPVLLALAGTLGACAPDAERVPLPGALKAEGDAFAAEGDWGRAAERYRLAFAVEDPLPERATARAWLAYLRGVALARVPQAEEAGRWFDRALRLDPGLYVVHFERGLLHDGRHPETTDKRAARAAFERFLAASEGAGHPPADPGTVAEARRALERLGTTTGVR